MICFQRSHFVFKSNNHIQVFQSIPIAHSPGKKAVLTSDLYKLLPMMIDLQMQAVYFSF